MSATRRGALLAGAGAALSLTTAGRAHAGTTDRAGRTKGPRLTVARDGGGDFTTTAPAGAYKPARPWVPGGDPANRPRLTAAEAVEHTPARHLGDWRPAVS